MALVYGPGAGALLRRPDAYTRLHLRCDGEGQVFRDETGQTITAVGGATQTATGARFATGKCLSLDGTGDYLTLGTKSNLDFLQQVGTTGKWSIAFWMYLNSLDGGPDIFDSSHGSSAGSGVLIYPNATSMWIGISAPDGFVCQTDVSTGGSLLDAWHYLVITYDQALASANLKMFVDGTQTGTANKSAVTPSTSTSNYAPTWGAEPETGDYCINARFDDIRFMSGICIDGTKVPTRRL